MYEVYVYKLADNVMYVGEGKKDRHLHITSGVSHVYEANELHFKGESKSLTVEVFPVDTKEEAVTLEDKLISELHPKWNRKTAKGITGSKETINRWCDTFKCTENVRNKTYLKKVANTKRLSSGYFEITLRADPNLYKATFDRCKNNNMPGCCEVEHKKGKYLIKITIPVEHKQEEQQ